MTQLSMLLPGLQTELQEDSTGRLLSLCHQASHHTLLDLVGDYSCRVLFLRNGLTIWKYGIHWHSLVYVSMLYCVSLVGSGLIIPVILYAVILFLTMKSISLESCHCNESAKQQHVNRLKRKKLLKKEKGSFKSLVSDS